MRREAHATTIGATKANAVDPNKASFFFAAKQRDDQTWG